MADDSYRIWCLVERDTTIFPVIASRSLSIGELKDLIKVKKNHALKDVDADKLRLWKVKVEVKDSGKINELNLTGRNVEDSVLITNVFENISDHWREPPTPNSLNIIVEVLPGGSPTLVPMARSNSTYLKTFKFWHALTICKTDREKFGRSSLGPNKISQLSGTKPEFLKQFITKLENRWVESHTNRTIPVLKDELHNFDKYVQVVPTGSEQGDLDSSERRLHHVACAFLLRGWMENEVKEENVRWIFGPLASYFDSVFGSRANHSFRGDWPLKLIVNVDSDSEKKDFRYTPRSDFYASVDQLPYLLVEVQSDKYESDRYQMLLQAACVARFGRQSYDKPYIVVALYIENSGRVTRYLVFEDVLQDDAEVGRVSFVSEVRDLRIQSELFTTIFELYNLAAIDQSEGSKFEGMQECIELLNVELSDNFEDTFMSKKRTQDGASKGGTRPKRPHKGGNTSNGEQVYNDQVVDAFTRAGYTLESNDEDENGLAPLNRLRPTMRHATQPNGDPVVVKWLFRSRELEILRHLHSSKSPDPFNHIIPLLDTLELDMGTFIVLPEATPLHLGFALGEFRSDVLDFGRQLIEGVAYLHSRGIAHLDIKPQNIVARRNQKNSNLPKQLFIIDFDIAVRVDGIDTLINRWCGTPGWMAPEIGDEDGPRCPYSPIRADLWSCGLMLMYLAKKGAVEENPFETLTRQLLNKNPQCRRPLFVERDHSRHSSNELQVRLKRKAGVLPHHVKRPAFIS